MIRIRDKYEMIMNKIDRVGMKCKKEVRWENDIGKSVDCNQNFLEQYPINHNLNIFQSNPIMIQKYKSIEHLSAMDQRLFQFLQGLKPEQLDGLHAIARRELDKHIQPLTYQRALEIYHNLQLNGGKKTRKNWKFQEVCFMAYLLDKSCLKFQTNIYQLDEEIWEKLALFLPSRTASSCKCKFLSFCPIRVVDVPWTESEDEALKELIGEFGFNWKKISQVLHIKNPNHVYRTSKQCKQHYGCFLKPDLKKGYWSPEQDYSLICNFLKHGKKWSRISQEIVGRNENAIKNRFYLLFESNSRHKKAYNSEIMRNVKRKKQRLQRALKMRSENLEKKVESYEFVQYPIKIQMSPEIKVQSDKQNICEKKGEEHEVVKENRHDLEQYFNF